jgi:hypothetical protein
MQYLNGQTVVAVGDGAEIFSGVVPSNGIVALGSYANQVTIGLPYTTTIQPMNPVLGSQQDTSKGKKQKFTRATLSMYESIGGQVGTDSSNLYAIDYTQNGGPAPAQGVPPSMFTGNVTQDLGGDWGDEDTIMIVHSDPFPFTLRSVTPRLSASQEG